MYWFFNACRTNQTPITNHRNVIYGKTGIKSSELLFLVASAVLKTTLLVVEIEVGINFVNTFPSKSAECQRKEKLNTETVP